MKGRKISKLEDGIIVAYVKNNPLNLRAAFEHAGVDLRRNPKTISNHWYTKLRKDEDVCFYVNAGKPNVKNSPRRH